MLRTAQVDAPQIRENATTAAIYSVATPAPERQVEVEEPGIPDDPSHRYEDLGLLGSGGMGQVRRVRDRDLNATVAMKIGHTSLMQDRQLLARFIAEAQATAQLAHPGIVPVHELGVLPDGRFYFTMREVTGKTLREAISDAHGPVGQNAMAVDSAWRTYRLVDAFHDVCEAVGYAHARGVVHRDLKPDNVMLGEWGEVLVLDWGLAKVRSAAELGELPDVQPVVTNRTIEPDLKTRLGIVAGTPYYMPPEQARGQFLSLGPASDVYALGAILFEILHGAPPWSEIDRRGLVEHLASGPNLDVTRAGHGAVPSKVPSDLLAIVERATRANPEHRFAHAGLLADHVRAWLEGARNRDRALDRVSKARVLQRSVSVLRRQVSALREEAAEVLAGLPAAAPVDDKAAAWELQDQADSLEQEAAQSESEALVLLHGAVLDVPNLDAAHQMLADHYRERHADAECRRDVNRAARLETLLRAHDRGRHAEYLEGHGKVSITVDAPRARVAIYKYVERLRQLVPTGLGRELMAPIIDLSLPQGSYLFVIRAEGRVEVRYPVLVRRMEHWDGVAPGRATPQVIHLPETWQMSERDCYVPAGWFVAGESRRLWIDGFAIRRLPVTVGDYQDFLDDVGESGGPGPSGRANDPVTGLDWHAADAYARWYAERTGEAWRLPTEMEWEKAARGADGRLHPWGDHFDPSFCNMSDSFADEATRPDAFPADDSPYGVRHMAGGVMELCSNPWHADPTGRGESKDRVARGGSSRSQASEVRATSRTRVGADQPSPALGFRLVRSVNSAS